MSSVYRNIVLATAISCFSLGIVHNVSAQQSGDKSRSSMDKSSDSKSTTDQASKKSSGDMTVLTPMLIMVPVKVSPDTAMKNGCWVKMYDQKNYQGDSMTLAGPIDMPTMTGPFGFNWENKVHSLEAGPKTTVTIYDNRNFRDQDKVIKGGTKVPELSKQMGFFDDFRSMKLNCS